MEEKKRMLEVSERPDGRKQININYSSLELMQTCMRKAKYRLIDELVKPTKSAPLVFGSAFHAAMETWYAAPLENRKPIGAKCLDYQDACRVGDPRLITELNHGGCARCAAIYSFLQKASDLDTIEYVGARTIDNGMDIINGYFDNYPATEDPFVVHTDKSGPYIERQCEHQIFDGGSFVINYHGTIDLILRNTLTEELFIVDHKTTYSLGKDFYNRIDPNFQYTGYVWLAQQDLGISSKSFMVNGVQVAKTVKSYRRQHTFRNEDHFHELKLAVVHAVKRWLDNTKWEEFPMNSPNPCSMYGGCGYRNICEVPTKMRDSVIRSNYETG